MPWSKVKNHKDCPSDSPWAVVKDETGEVEGCHETEEQANDQLAALNAAEQEESLAEHPDDCPPGQHRMPDGECMPDSEMTSGSEQFINPKQFLEDIADSEIVFTDAGWTGVLVVEGLPTGDGREFAPDALTWRDLPIPLRWNKEDSHGGVPHTVAVNVGRIDAIWREDEKIMARGVLDLEGENGKEAHRLLEKEFLKGVSVDVDDISEADIEMIFPDEGEEADDGFIMLMPEKVIFHGGRISAATLVDIPAFAEAYIELDSGSIVAGAVGPHDTATSDKPWDASANEKRLDSPLTLDQSRRMYAWFDNNAVDDGMIAKTNAKFPHHEVSADGSIGAANLQACSSGIGVLNGARGGVDIPSADMQGVYNHLAGHIRDAGNEPPEATFIKVNDYFDAVRDVVRASVSVDEDAPSHEWFTDPKLSLPTGITVTDEGRVYGHAAMWGECHVGFTDICVTPPHEDLHPYFMTGELVCSNGSRVAVGQITVGTGHAHLYKNAQAAAEHYDNTGTAVADVAIGNDEHGIWVAGAIRPDVDIKKIRDLRASGQVSGDWRRIGGQLRLVGLLAVNVPGFPVPSLRARVASGAPLALVAAGKISVARPSVDEDEKELEKRALKAMAQSIARRVKAGRK